MAKRGSRSTRTVTRTRPEEAAETAQALFLKYEFVKSAEEALSKYSEAVRELARARKAAVACTSRATLSTSGCKG